MMMNNSPLTCAEFEALVPDLLDGTLAPRDRDAMDAHRLDCAACDAIVADLLSIKQQAANLPALTPSRELWSGIESRIQAEVVEFPRTPIPGEVVAIATTRSQIPVPSSQLGSGIWDLGSRHRVWTIAAAASLLVAATAAITWSIASRSAAPVETAQTVADSGLMRLASAPAMELSYDREISDLRRIVDEHRAEMDSVTAAVLERNLKVIDDAIAESKAALAASPESAFLLDRLNDAYATKLRTLRAVAVARRG